MNSWFVRSFVKTYGIKKKPMRERIDCLVDFINFICKYERQYDIISARYDSSLKAVFIDMFYSPGKVYTQEDLQEMKKLMSRIASKFGLTFSYYSMSIIDESKRMFTIGSIERR
jgi:hypothetical protein